MIPPPAEIADGVFAHVQGDGGWCLSNAGVIAGADRVAVVDTAATQRRALALRDVVRRVSRQPVRIVVNTHHHGDHTFGNSVVGPDATVVAHPRTRADMERKGLAMTGSWPDVEWGDLTVVLPSLTVADRAVVHVGDTEVHLWHPGPAHTDGDLIVWLPRERVLFTGDVVMSGCTPFVLMGSLAGSLDVLDGLAALEPATVVAGHGPVGGPEIIEENARYLRWVAGLALEGERAGRTPLEVATETDLGEFAGLVDPERLVANLHRAYAELPAADGMVPPRGAHLASAAAMADMAAYKGGPLTSAA